MTGGQAPVATQLREGTPGVPTIAMLLAFSCVTFIARHVAIPLAFVSPLLGALALPVCMDTRRALHRTLFVALAAIVLTLAIATNLATEDRHGTLLTTIPFAFVFPYWIYREFRIWQTPSAPYSG